MRRPRAQEVLSKNLLALMASRPDVGSSIKLAKACKVGNGTIGRIRLGTAACQIDTLEAIAAVFHLEPWQLLIPDLDPRNPPILRGASRTERELYEKLDALLAEKKLA